MKRSGRAFSPRSRIVVLTGAGLSAESGIATFRDAGGIWSEYELEDVATPDGFRRNPALVQSFYNRRRADHAKAKPNAAHLALARLEREHAGRVDIVTQNVDALHEAAGSRNLIHMHGELLKAWCTVCDARVVWTTAIAPTSTCTACSRVGTLRPDVVWFGEVPYAMERIKAILSECDLFISIGTSGNVYPAAGFVETAAAVGAHSVELNIERTVGASVFDEVIQGPATAVVPAYVSMLLDGAP